MMTTTATAVESDARRRRVCRLASVDDCSGGEATRCVGGTLTTRLEPATCQDAPVRSAEVCVAQSVAERVHRAVDVAQPVA